ncbi:MAG: lytic transglycosylase domain-containing protein [Pseudomonadales bacterium]|jgi:soluble lytic murein transglycosylase-like protein|nr:lytic transglycosylase domain-containing protein [Pseudomonadales bacterium]
MEAFSGVLRHLSRFGRELLRTPHPMLLVALLGAPAALSASLVVGAQVAASAPRSFTLALPSIEVRSPWRQEVEAFSLRLERGFGLEAERADSFAAWILEASARQALPPELIASLIYTESTFRTRVRSWSGAVGPAQVKPRFWTRFCGGVDLTDPEQNVYCGAQIIAHYSEQCGDVECAFRLYNVGPSNVRDPYYLERSHLYLTKIEDGRSRLENGGAEAPAAAAF